MTRLVHFFITGFLKLVLILGFFWLAIFIFPKLLTHSFVTNFENADIKLRRSSENAPPNSLKRPTPVAEPTPNPTTHKQETDTPNVQKQALEHFNAKLSNAKKTIDSVEDKCSFWTDQYQATKDASHRYLRDQACQTTRQSITSPTKHNSPHTIHQLL
jgi:hypothetical protein